MDEIKILITFNRTENYVGNDDEGESEELLKREYDKAQLKKVSSSSRISHEVSHPTWDVVSGRATIIIADINGELKEFALAGELRDINKVQILFANQLIGTYSSVEAQYDLKSGECRLTCRDNLHAWDTISYVGIPHNLTNNAYSFFTFLKDTTKTLTTTDDDVILENLKQKDFLESIKLPNGFLRPQTLRNAWRQLCEITLSYIYKDIDGMIKFVTSN